MKTNLKKYMLALALSPMLLSSCGDDFLEEVNPNQQTPATFWINEENCMKGLSAVYNPLRRMTWGYYGGHHSILHFQMRADDLYPTRGEEAPIWEALSFTNTSNTGNDMWAHIYRGIQLANEFIYNAPNVPMDQTKLDQMIGEAYFMRGFWYFRLQCDYGMGPIRTLPQAQDTEAKPCSSKEDILAQCAADFEEAKKRLPKTRPGDENGRVTQGAAIAMLGKTLVWQKKYAEAKQEFESIMTGYNYDLMADYSHNFRDDHEFNEESLFEINYDKFGNTGDNWGSSQGNNAGMIENYTHFFGPAVPGKKGGWYKMQPSPYLVKQFIAEERPEGSDTKFDKRLYTTCFFKHSDYEEKEDELYFGDVEFDKIFVQTALPGHDNKWRIGNGGAGPAYPEINGKPGRFLMKKMTTWWSTTGCGMYGNPDARVNNFRIMRFAEVLFLHAEAALETGDEAAAMNDINRIRVRAGLAKKQLSGKAAIMEELRNQKLLEFAAENVRWDDLVRWYSYEELKQILLERKVDSKVYEQVGDDAWVPVGDFKDTQNYAGFQKKHMYFPIPQSEVDANQALEQNPDWK